MQFRVRRGRDRMTVGSLLITAKVVSSIPAHDEVYSIYII